MRAWLGVAFALSLDAVAAVVHLRGNQSLMADERGPRVYFLFLAVDKISNLDVWTAFFNSAEKEQYRAFAHCKEQSCQQQLAESPIVPVPTVPSYYCTDLVSPMNQLLSYALSKDLGAGNARDKFAFVSDSALPAKPFSHIHQVLSHREGSDFCVFPPGEWADLPDADAMEVAVKVHQWITLTREHAQRAVEQWQKKVMQNFMGYFKMNQLAWNNMLDNNFADDRNWGCLDEFWFVTALFGTLKRVSRHGDQSIDLPQFTGSPLRIDQKAGWQGQCDTFVIWAKYMYSLGRNSQENLMLSLDPASVPHGGNWARPGWWDTISMQGIQAIRKSDFLFVRKFIDKPSLHDGDSFAAAYTRIIVKDDLP
ncbi:Uncharacterized protein SCF082_LOCUS21747 [Durusdinium trenchii]|uniref:Phospholipase B-like n=1 Tax=Durusdinium trenchii TaxID=1381693 RepID=A0ABP0LEB2_9DINO